MGYDCTTITQLGGILLCSSILPIDPFWFISTDNENNGGAENMNEVPDLIQNKESEKNQNFFIHEFNRQALENEKKTQESKNVWLALIATCSINKVIFSKKEIDNTSVACCLIWFDFI